ncbi:MAG TPA: response regulator transcription factor [Polyangiaceae bacterium]
MSLDRGRVLLADDEHAMRDYLGRALRKAGFFVETASSGAEVAELFRNASFDVLLSDINMPGNTHLELLSLIRDEQVILPVVVMTGHPNLESAVGVLRLGGVDYITKPLDIPALLLLLDEAIGKGRALRALGDAKQRAAVFMASVTALEQAIALCAPTRTGMPVPTAQEKSANPLIHLSSEELSRLSEREREVTHLLALGTPVSGVATTLGLSPNTVRSHIKSVFVKLRVHSQIALMSKLAGHSQ